MTVPLHLRSLVSAATTARSLWALSRCLLAGQSSRMEECRSHYEERFSRDDPYDLGRPENRFALLRGYAGVDLVDQVSRGWQVECALDVGCGDWGVFYQVPRLAGARLATAGDISFRAVQKARQRSPSQDTQFMVFDAEHLPFRSATFDLVHCREVLEHLPHAGVALDEIRRVATGNVILSVPNEELVGKLEPEHVQTFGYESFLRALSAAHLEVQRVLGIYFFSRHISDRRLRRVPFGPLVFRLLLVLGKVFPKRSLQILAWCTPGRTPGES